MIAPNKTAVIATTFTVGYAVLYVICTELNLPVVSYHPLIGEIDLLRTPERRGPAMYWYGWMLSALIGAAVLAGIAAVVPEKWMQRTMAFGSFVAVGYVTISSLAFFAYDRAPIELEWLKSRWLSVAAAIALAAIVSYLVSAKWGERVWPGWASVVPIGALAVVGYYLTPYFTR
jgi:hypothetical protein